MDGFLHHLVALLFTGMAVAVGGSSPAATAPRHGHVWPLTPRPAVVRRFEAPPEPWATGHRGVDLLGHEGQTVRSSGAGRVTFSGVIAGVGVVTVTESNGWRTTYQPVTHRAHRGEVVAPGDRIGTLTAAGSHCAPRSCLHWGWLVAPETYRDPLDLLVRRRPVLLPLP